MKNSISASNAAESAVFVQTAAPACPDLDTWTQVGEAEAEIAKTMTLANELSGGTPAVRRFEDIWRKRTGCKHVCSVINGTGALYSAFFGLGVGPGDEVICPSFTWIASVAPAVFLGARPVFCEVDPETLLIDVADVRRRITPRTRAIVVVHLWGNVCNLDALLALSRETGIPIVEDCSHAHGALWRGRSVGSFGAIGCWSLQGSKAVSAGEGGFLATNDDDVFERACLLGQVNRLKGVDLVTPRYAKFQPLGFGMKFRAHPLGIGIAVEQTRKLDTLNAGRRSHVEAVEAGLRTIPCLRPVRSYEGATRGGYYGFPIVYTAKGATAASTAAFVEQLQREGLKGATTCPYPALHRLPLFAQGFDLYTRNRGPLSRAEGYPGYREGDLTATENVVDRLVFLPVLSKPRPDAAATVLSALRRTAETMQRQLVSA